MALRRLIHIRLLVLVQRGHEVCQTRYARCATLVGRVVLCWEEAERWARREEREEVRGKFVSHGDGEL